MGNLQLKRLWKRDLALAALVGDLASALAAPIAVQDVDGTALWGEAAGLDERRAAIEHSGEILGWVSGSAQAPIVARLLAHVLAQEAVKKALAAEVLEKYRELNLLYNFSDKLINAPEVERMGALALAEAGRLIEATAGAVILLDQEGGRRVIGAFGPPLRWLAEPASPGNLVEKVMQTGEAQLLNGVDGRQCFQDSFHLICSILCAPLKTEKRSLGAILLVGGETIDYSARDLKLLNTVALQVAPAIEMARLYQIAVEKGRLERELQMAYQVQASLIPLAAPQIVGWEFAGRWQPAREVSGDYYDFIPEADGRLGLVIADVADKGMPASLFMVFTPSAVRASADGMTAPAEVISHANRLVASEASQGLFVTLVYARLDPETGALSYVNAGHNPPLLYRCQTEQLVKLERTGLPLGINEDLAYDQREVRLDSGDFVLFYTDGITEAMDGANHDFGLERLQRLVLDQRQSSAEEITASVLAAVKAFANEEPAFDDITLMIARRL
ncbi:MAG: PP2C family protein-serine/threonine phosphatase [Candidatus Promineifilaceae bacterium]